MKTLKEKAKIDQAIMRIANVQEIRHVIAHTNKGDLCLMLCKGQSEKDYRFVLDAVPYDDQTNKDLMQMFAGVLFSI